jgi:Leucine Rich repeat
MEEEQHQRQQQQQPLHSAVVKGIARLDDPLYRKERHELAVEGSPSKPRVNRHSLQHLVRFLDNIGAHKVRITKLELCGIRLLDPSDGGLDVLRRFFSRSDTTLTNVTLKWSRFGSQEENLSQLLSAFHTNRTITDLTICGCLSTEQEGAMLTPCISDLMQNMPHLQRLHCSYSMLPLEGVRAFQPVLRANRTLKQLHLEHCYLGDEGTRLFADALVGNTTMDALNLRTNCITSAGLAEITRLLVSTQLKTIKMFNNIDIFKDQDATQHFVSTLQQKKSSVQDLPDIEYDNFRRNVPDDDEDSKIAMFASIKNNLVRNQQLNRVNFLLTPPQHQKQQQRQQQQQQQQQQHRNSGITMMLKVLHQALTKFATTVTLPSNHATGASAIFKLFQARPSLLEKRLKRPTRLLLLRRLRRLLLPSVRLFRSRDNNARRICNPKRVFATISFCTVACSAAR